MRATSSQVPHILRRRAPRVPFTGDVSIHAASKNISIKGINISTSGILTWALGFLPSGVPILLTLKLPGHPPQILRSELAREGMHLGRPVWGITFKNISIHNHSLINGYVRHAMQDRPKTGRGLDDEQEVAAEDEFDDLPSTGEMQQMYREVLEEIDRQEIAQARRRSKKRGFFRRKGSSG